MFSEIKAWLPGLTFYALGIIAPAWVSSGDRAIFQFATSYPHQHLRRRT